jgi:hypothetical protein
LELSEAALTVYDATFAAVLALSVGACVLAFARRGNTAMSWKLELAWSAVPMMFVLGLWISATRFIG